MAEYSTFEAPEPTKVYHIIWNILLADKQFPLTLENLKKNKIGHIVAILPSSDEFNKLCSVDVPKTVMEYGHSHDLGFNKKQYNEIGQFIDTLARSFKEESERNVLIFCNNGYQRSVPFLVYYLTTFHSEECPSISKAIDLIIPQVDKLNYLSLREKIINDISLILSTSSS